MTADPPIRADGLCAQCEGERRQPKNRQRGIDPALYLLDPFCSQLCARAYHDNPLPSFVGGKPAERRGRHERAAA